MLCSFLLYSKVIPLYISLCQVKSLSCVQLFAVPWVVAHQIPPSMGFSRQEYWSGLPFPSPGDLPDAGIEPRSPALQADALPSEPPGKLSLSIYMYIHIHFQILFHYGLSQDIEYSSLWYTVGPCLSILNVTVCIYQT